MVLGGTGSIEGGTVHYMMVLGQYRAVLDISWWYTVSIGRYWIFLGGTRSVVRTWCHQVGVTWLVTGWFIYDGSGSVRCGTGWYLVVLGQYGTVLLVLGGAGSV